MSGLSFLAVFGGAGFGALLRWWLSAWLNPVFPTVPLGTVAANLVGGLLVITGFMGGLTTFSTFSAEVVNLIARHEHWWALAAASVHLFGSLVLTGIGIIIANALFVRA